MNTLFNKTPEQLNAIIVKLQGLISASKDIDIHENAQEIWKAVYSANSACGNVDDDAINYQYVIARDFFVREQKDKKLSLEQIRSIENTVRLIESELDVRAALSLLDDHE